MTLFKTAIAASPTVYTPLPQPLINWSSDQDKLKKLKEVITKLSTGTYGEKIRNFVLNIGGADKIAVSASGSTPPVYTIHAPILETTRQSINIYYLGEFTTIFAIDHLNSELKKYLTTSPRPAKPLIYDDLILNLRAAGSKKGFTNNSLIESFLTEEEIGNVRINNIKAALPPGSTNHTYDTTSPDKLNDKTKEVYETIMEVLYSHVNYLSTSLFNFLISGRYIPPTSKFVAVGDGNSGTKGLYGNDEEALLFFKYSFNTSVTPMRVNPANDLTFARIGGGAETIIHFNVFGLDTWDGDLNDPSLPAFNSKRDYNSLMQVKITNKPATGPDESLTFYVKKMGDTFILRSQAYTVASKITGTFTSSGGNIILDEATCDIRILDTDNGQFKINVTAARFSVTDPRSVQPDLSFDETVMSISVLPAKKMSVVFDLDSDNMFDADSFITNSTVWTDAKSIDNLDILINASLKTGISIIPNLKGCYIGKRAKPYDQNATYTKGEIVYYLNNVFECRVASSLNVAPVLSVPPSGNWSIKYKAHSPSNSYNKNDIVVIDRGAGRYRQYECLYAIKAQAFDLYQWKQVSVVEKEKDRTKFESADNDDLKKYSFANVGITGTTISIDIMSFVSPDRSRLDKALALRLSGTPAQKLQKINDFNTNFTTSQGVRTFPSELLTPPANNPVDPGLNTAPDHPIYNIPLSCLRSFGLWEVLKNKIIARATSLTTLNATEKSDITTLYNNAFTNSSVKIPIIVDRPAPSQQFYNVILDEYDDNPTDATDNNDPMKVREFTHADWLIYR